MLKVGQELEVTWVKARCGNDVVVELDGGVIFRRKNDWPEVPPVGSRWRVRLSHQPHDGIFHAIPLQQLACLQGSSGNGNGLPAGVEVVFKPGRAGRPVAFFDGRACFPDRRDWIEAGLPIPSAGERWLVNVGDENRACTCYYLLPVRCLDSLPDGNGRPAVEVETELWPDVFEVTFEPSRDEDRQIAFFRGKACLLDAVWSAREPRIGERWRVRFEGENPRQTVMFVSDVECLGLDPDWQLPEPQVLVFVEGRETAIAHANGKACLPSLGEWRERPPKPKEKWFVEFVGRNGRGTTFFVKPLEFRGLYDPLDDLPPLPQCLPVVFEQADGKPFGVCAWIGQRPAVVEEVRDRRFSPQGGQRWIVELLDAAAVPVKVAAVARFDMGTMTDGLEPHPRDFPLRKCVRFRATTEGDRAIGFLGRKAVFPDRNLWTERLPLPGETWVVDIVDDCGACWFAVPVCRRK